MPTLLFKLKNMREKTKRIIVVVISIMFILLFVYAASSKFFEFQKFQVQLSQSPLLTRNAILLSWIVPTLEIGISLLLSSELFRLLGLYLSFSLMILFTGYIVLITRFSEFIPCSCGGVLQNLSWNQHLVFNLGFACLGMLGVLLFDFPTKHKQKII